MTGGEITLLNYKQEQFCLHYAKTGNATESYKKAGYNAKNDNSAGADARRLLQKDKIQARLAELTEEMRSEKIASAAEVQERLTRILRMEETEDVVVVEGIDKGISEARVVEKRPQLKDVIKAGETLARMQGAFDNSVNVNINVPVIGGEDNLED